MEKNPVAAALWQARFTGGTFSLSGKPAKIKGDYAVGGFVPGITFTDTADSDEFRAKVNEWLGTLPARKCYVGVWHDAGTIFVDGTDIISNKENAIEVAKRRGELAIWSFADGAEIRVR